jgi:hypothetical protein
LSSDESRIAAGGDRSIDGRRAEGERQEESRKAFLFEQEVESNLNSALPFKALYSSKVPLSSEEQRRVGKEELDALDAVTNEQLGQRWRTLSYGAIALALFGLSAAGAAPPNAVSRHPIPQHACERVKAQLSLKHATVMRPSVPQAPTLAPTYPISQC